MERLLKETPILNYNHLLIKNLIEQRKWNELADVDKVKKVSEEYIKDSEVKKDLNSAINAVFGLKKGEEAPKVNLVKLDGKSSSFESNGKPTLVMTYASWNPYIGQSTVPVLKEVVNFYKSKVNFAFGNFSSIA